VAAPGTPAPLDGTVGWSCRTAQGGTGQTVRARAGQIAGLLGVWTEREFRVRYRQSALDALWSVIQPVGIVLIYGFLFSIVLQVSTGGLPYLAFAFAGIAPWRFIAFATSSAFPSITAAQGTITKVYFPREVLPLSVVGASLVDLAIATLILFIVAVVQGVGLDVTVLALVPVDVVLVLWVAAICVLGASVSVFVRDVVLFLPLAQQLLFVASPIMYPASLTPDSLSWLNEWNPVAVVVEATRDAVLRHSWPDWPLLAIHGAAATGVLLLALAYSRTVERHMADLA